MKPVPTICVMCGKTEGESWTLPLAVCCRECVRVVQCYVLFKMSADDQNDDSDNSNSGEQT